MSYIYLKYLLIPIIKIFKKYYKISFSLVVGKEHKAKLVIDQFSEHTVNMMFG